MAVVTVLPVQGLRQRKEARKDSSSVEASSSTEKHKNLYSSQRFEHRSFTDNNLFMEKLLIISLKKKSQ